MSGWPRHDVHRPVVVPVLLEARGLPLEVHSLSRRQCAEPFHLDVGEVAPTTPRCLRGIKYAPPFLVAPLTDSRSHHAGNPTGASAPAYRRPQLGNRPRMPSPLEIETLRLASGVPVIHLIRTALRHQEPRGRGMRHRHGRRRLRPELTGRSGRDRDGQWPCSLHSTPYTRRRELRSRPWEARAHGAEASAASEVWTPRRACGVVSHRRRGQLKRKPLLSWPFRLCPGQDSNLRTDPTAADPFDTVTMRPPGTPSRTAAPDAWSSGRHAGSGRVARGGCTPRRVLPSRAQADASGVGGNLAFKACTST